MSNVNHRYSSESWALDLSGKRSPLSRWTGRDVLSHESFRLSLLGAEGGVAPVVWLAGDRACFEALYQVVEGYVQSGLREPVLAGQSTFPSVNGKPASNIPASNIYVESNGAGNPTTASSPDTVGEAEGDGDRAQFSLTAQGLLRHRLSYSPADSNSPPRQMQLSTLQLADLLAVLEQWQTDTLALPERKARLRVLPGGQSGDFVMPTWGRIAASLLVALGATGSGAYLLLNLPSSEEQVALESAPADADAVATSPSFGAGASGAPGGAFGQFPTASGPPITSQAQDADAAFNNPLVLPKDADALPPPPAAGLPTTPLPRDSDLGQIPLPQSLPGGVSVDGPTPSVSGGLSGGLSGSIASSSETGASASSGDDRFINDLGLGSNEILESNAEAPPFPEPTVEDGPLLAGQAGADSAEASSDVIGEVDIVASAPPLTQQPGAAELNTASAPASSAATADGNDKGTTTSEAIASTPSVFIGAADDSPEGNTGGSSRGGFPPGEAARIGAAAPLPPAAPPSPQVTVAKPLPSNNQSRAVQSYLQSQWKAPAAIQQPLQYRLSVSPEGKLASVEALSPTAQLYVNDAQLPAVGSAISGAADTVQSTMVVTLTPSGQVNVAIEKAVPVTP